MSVIEWLLQNDAPGVAYVARQCLLDEAPASRKMKSLRRRCNEYPPVARMLDCGLRGISKARRCGCMDLGPSVRSSLVNDGSEIVVKVV